MSGLVLKKYSPLVNRMKMESGNRTSPIWLLVNPKYPAAHQDIWIPILEVIQDKVYRKLHNRIGTEHIFIKSSVSNIGIVSQSLDWWGAEVAKEIEILKESINEFKPKILITFGSITYELIKRIIELRPEKGPRYWSTTNLEHEFESSIANFDINKINKIPLRHRVMKTGKHIEDHHYSSWEESENYFRDVGTKIADRIIENKDSFKIWI